MTTGVVAELNELIALQQLVTRTSYQDKAFLPNRSNHLSRIRGRGMEFAEVRNYQAGDEIRHMEWRVTARTGRAHVKVFQEEREQVFMLLVDFNASMFFGTRIAFKSVLAARLAALLAWTAIKQGDRIGAFLYSARSHQEFMPKTRKAAVLPLLAGLSDYTKSKAPQNPPSSKPIDLAEELLRLRRVTKPGSKIVLISDFYQMNADCVKHLARLRAHNDIIAFHVCDALEVAPPPPGLYPISDGQQELLIDTEHKQNRALYQSFCEEHRSKLQSQCHRLNIRYVPIEAKDSLMHLIRQTGFWRKGG